MPTIATSMLTHGTSKYLLRRCMQTANRSVGQQRVAIPSWPSFPELAGWLNLQLLRGVRSLLFAPIICPIVKKGGRSLNQSSTECWKVHLKTT